MNTNTTVTKPSMQAVKVERPTVPEMNLLRELIARSVRYGSNLGEVLAKLPPEDRALMFTIFAQVIVPSAPVSKGSR